MVLNYYPHFTGEKNEAQRSVSKICVQVFTASKSWNEDKTSEPVKQGGQEGLVGKKKKKRAFPNQNASP